MFLLCILVAAGAKAAMEGSFELIVLDVMLPDKKGFNVLKDDIFGSARGLPS